MENLDHERRFCGRPCHPTRRMLDRKKLMNRRKEGYNGDAMATKAAPTVTPLEAQGAANLFLSDRLGDRFLAVRPQLDEGGDVWRVPVVLTYAVVGPVGAVGERMGRSCAQEGVSHS